MLMRTIRRFTARANDRRDATVVRTLVRDLLDNVSWWDRPSFDEDLVTGLFDESNAVLVLTAYEADCLRDPAADPVTYAAIMERL